MTDLPWTDPDPRPSVPTPRKCRRHEWAVARGHPASRQCIRCNATRDIPDVRRGASANRRGKDAERAIAKAYGGQRVGQYGGPADVVVGELFVIQSKVRRGSAFPRWMADELDKLPRTGGRIPTLVVSDAPGPGHRTRRLVVRDYQDDLELHGGKA